MKRVMYYLRKSNEKKTELIMRIETFINLEINKYR